MIDGSLSCLSTTSSACFIYMLIDQEEDRHDNVSRNNFAVKQSRMHTSDSVRNSKKMWLLFCSRSKRTFNGSLSSLFFYFCKYET